MVRKSTEIIQLFIIKRAKKFNYVCCFQVYTTWGNQSVWTLFKLLVLKFKFEHFHCNKIKEHLEKDVYVHFPTERNSGAWLGPLRSRYYVLLFIFTAEITLKSKIEQIVHRFWVKGQSSKNRAQSTILLLKHYWPFAFLTWQIGIAPTTERQCYGYANEEILFHLHHYNFVIDLNCNTSPLRRVELEKRDLFTEVVLLSLASLFCISKLSNARLKVNCTQCCHLCV